MSEGTKERRTDREGVLAERLGPNSTLKEVFGKTKKISLWKYLSIHIHKFDLKITIQTNLKIDYLDVTLN